ncbi:MAG: citrate/2-methylcitrate synthase [Sandaracinaceae bacterium]
MAESGLIGAREACRRLGVKRATLYSYVSRGKVRCVARGGREKLYSAADVERLALRSAARRGHAAVAVGALRFGEPVLDSAITSVHPELTYRGRSVAALLRDRVPYEKVAEHLWQADPVSPWPATDVPDPGDLPLVWRMVQSLPPLALRDPSRHVSSPRAELTRARGLLRALGAALARQPTLHDRLAPSLAAHFGGLEHTDIVNAVLVACADHELNVSTFAARVAASSGADLYACVGAALYAFTGPRHGAAGDRVEALVDACRARGVRREVNARLARGESLPGFGHPLYPDGDPRTPPLLDLVRETAALPPRAAVLLEIVDCVERETGVGATVDLGGVAVALAMRGPAGLGSALFGLGRVAGWVAHTLEQRARPELLRPRARYVGR